MTDSPRSRLRLPHGAWLLLATIVLVVGYLGLSVWLPYHVEQQIVQKIETSGGLVETRIVGPKWLRRLAGEDRVKEFKVLTRVEAVQLLGMENTDAETTYLSGLLNIQKLWLADTAATDASLAHLSGLTNLEELWLKRTKITDAGLPRLSGLKKLRCLSLYGTKVTDSGLVHLSGLTNLELLYLHATPVTDEGIEELQKALPDCKIFR